MHLIVELAVFHVSESMVCKNQNLVIASLQFRKHNFIDPFLFNSAEHFLIRLPPKHKADVVHKHITSNFYLD
jgi:hypothetical protein